VATRLRRAGFAGRTVTLKIRYGDFETRTRSRTSPVSLAEGPAIAALASDLFEGLDLAAGVRLLGVGVSNLSRADAVEQMSLDLDPGAQSGRQVSAADAVDAIRERFGSGAVGPAVLLGRDGLRVKRRGDTQWGPSADDPRTGETMDGDR
jgi:DNA polymerase IV